ncbi:MAG: alpha/beta hydrolase [Chitinophagales bacterium]
MSTSELPRIFLLHGFAENSAFWSLLRPLLPVEYTYIVPDLPGFGASSPVPLPDIDAYAQHFRQTYLHSGERILLLGHSMGGYITMAFAERFPEQLIAAGLLHSHVFADSEEQRSVRERSIAFIRNNGTEIYLRNFAKKLFAAETDDAVLQEHIRTILATPADGLTTALHTMMQRRDTQHVLESADIPFLFLFGRQDTLMPVDTLMQQTAPVKKKTVHILEHSGHMGMLEEPVLSARHITDFLHFAVNSGS